MLKAVRLFKFAGLLMLAVAASLPAYAAEVVEFKENPSSTSRDLFEQNIYYEGTNFLHLDRLYRKIFHQKKRARDVNIFDEIPDNTFFTNRHARKTLSEEELTRGYQESQGPDVSGTFTILSGKFEGSNPGFYIKDSFGEEYLLKFDSADSLGLETSAIVIASRFYYALGYNVPQNKIAKFESSKLVPGAGVKVIDGTGFNKILTKDKLEEYLLLIPWNEDGKFQALASKSLPGPVKGGFAFQGRRRHDPEDGVDHEDRREIRALQVFASWLQDTGIQQQSTSDVVQEVNGRPILKHYLVDMSSALGVFGPGAKPPHFAHEYFMDYGETTKAILGLGLWEKPWQKRWREAGEKTDAPAVGYLDNRYFDPKKFKTQLPHYAFKDLTRADGFWAAKMIMAFRAADIAAMVKAGEYNDPKITEAVAKILTDRRDILGRYWFSQACPLDNFDVKDSRLVFEDLAVTHQFEQVSQTSYEVEVFAGRSTKKKIVSVKISEPSLRLDPNWFQGQEKVTLRIRVSRSASPALSPYVRVETTSGAVTGIVHED